MLHNLRDLIPKVVGNILIEKSSKNLNMSIISGINKSNEVLEVLSEVRFEFWRKRRKIQDR